MLGAKTGAWAMMPGPGPPTPGPGSISMLAGGKLLRCVSLPKGGTNEVLSLSSPYGGCKKQPLMPSIDIDSRIEAMRDFMCPPLKARFRDLPRVSRQVPLTYIQLDRTHLRGRVGRLAAAGGLR